MILQPQKSQQGVTLIMSLVILVTLTLIGLSSMQGSRTELAMAGNLRESDLTFQLAEVGLKDAETFIASTNSSAGFNNATANGLWDENDDDPDYFDELTTWNLARTSTTSLPSGLTQPLYVVKFLGERSNLGGGIININNISNQQPGKIVSNYRSTSRSVGRTGNSFRYLQSYFGVEY